jgi:hypothetical protein
MASLTGDVQSWAGEYQDLDQLDHEGFAALGQARNEIDKLVSQDAANDLFQFYRVGIVANQALGFAYSSKEASASIRERRQRLAQARKYLAEAEQFSLTVKVKVENFGLQRARQRVAVDDVMKNLHGTNWIGSASRLSTVPVSGRLRSRVVSNPRRLTAAAHQDARSQDNPPDASARARTTSGSGEVALSRLWFHQTKPKPC